MGGIAAAHVSWGVRDCLRQSVTDGSLVGSQHEFHSARYHLPRRSPRRPFLSASSWSHSSDLAVVGVVGERRSVQLTSVVDPTARG